MSAAHPPRTPIDPRVMKRVMIGLLITAALLCAALAAAVSSDTWVGWLQHPSRDPDRAAAVEGARLLRLMLGVLAATLALAAALLHRAPPLPSPATATTTTRAVPRDSLSVEAWIVLGVLALAAALRLARVGESLWYDEIAMWITFGAHGPGAIVGNYFDPVNHIAHTLATWASVQLNELVMGLELAMRLPALGMSLLTVPVVFALCRLVFPARVSLVAAGLTAVLPVAVLSGVEARGYSTVICLAAASTWALVQARRTHRPELYLAYAALAALAVWTHLVTVTFFIGHGLWIAWTAWRDRDLRRSVPSATALALAAALTLTLYAPVLPEVAGQLRADFQRTEGQATGALFGAEGLRTLWQLGGSWTWWAALPGLVLIALGVVWLWQDRREPLADERREPIALLWLGLAVALVIVVLAGTWVYARFMLFIVPAAAVTMALGVELLWRWRREAGIAAVVVMGVVASIDVLARPAKQPLREAAEFVLEHRQVRDRVLAVTIAHEVLHVYAGDLPVAHSLFHGHHLPAQIERHRPEWVIVLYPEHLAPDAGGALEAHGYVTAQRYAGWIDDGDVVIYRRR